MAGSVASPESILPVSPDYSDLWLWISGSRAAHAPRNDVRGLSDSIDPV
jgi:hypothetical protein